MFLHAFTRFYTKILKVTRLYSVVLVSHKSSKPLCRPLSYKPIAMTSTEILLVINSILLGVISLMFVLIGYFLKDLHKDFKHLMERVNKQHAELHTHITMFENLTKLFQRQIDGLSERIKKVEKLTINKQV